MSKQEMDARAVNELVAMMEQRMGSAAPALRSDMRVVRPQTARERATEAWQWHDINMPSAAACDVDQAPRARAVREINRISLTYGWGGAVAKWIDGQHAVSVNSLSDEQVDDLLAHMRHLVSCAETGCDPEEALPAR